MIQNVLRHLGGVDVYGVLSLCLFFSIFSVSILWALTRRKAHLDEMARLPLEDIVNSPDNHDTRS